MFLFFEKQTFMFFCWIGLGFELGIGAGFGILGSINPKHFFCLGWFGFGFGMNQKHKLGLGFGLGWDWPSYVYGLVVKKGETSPSGVV